MKKLALEKQFHKVMDAWSNDKLDPASVDEKWIEEFAEHCKQSLIKQLTPRPEGYSNRASGMGKALCVLQREKEQAPKSKKDYNFKMKMLVGDITEGVVSFLAKVGRVGMSAENTEIKLKIDGDIITGTDDHTINGKVYDSKTCSDFAWKFKWLKGYEGLKESDDFGYITQLYTYALGQGIDAGGWIVVNKSTGELLVVDVPKDKVEEKRVKEELKFKLKALREDWSFTKCYDVDDDYFNRKYTGSQKLNKNCHYCDFRAVCWPHAQLLPRANSTAKTPTFSWYTRYLGKDLINEDTKRKSKRAKTATVGKK